MAEGERRRWTRENAYLYVRPDAERFLRPDAERLLKPSEKLDRYWERPEFQSPAMRGYAKAPTPGRAEGYAGEQGGAAGGASSDEARLRRTPAQSYAHASADGATSGFSDREILKLKSDLAALRAHLALVGLAMGDRKARGLPPLTEADPLWRSYVRKQAAFDAAWRKAGFDETRHGSFEDDGRAAGRPHDGRRAGFDDASRKAGFNADQPRVPAGSPDGGQWTEEGAVGEGAGGGGGRADAVPGRVRRVRLADAGSSFNPGVLSDAMPIDGPTPNSTESDSRHLTAQPNVGDAFTNNVEIPSSVPAHVDLNRNIKEAESNRGNFLWFYNQVRNNGPWDYKQLNKEYEAFGNFNYGAAGAATGFSEATLLRTAGWAHARAGNSLPEWGRPVTLIEALLGIGGIAPFGDDPEDQRWISSGVRYYNALRRNRGGR